MLAIMKNFPLIPDISEEEKTPLVRLLLVIIDQLHAIVLQQGERIILLEDEIKRLKGHTPRPTIKPSVMEGNAREPKAPVDPANPKKKNKNHKKNKKTEKLVVHASQKVTIADKPKGARFKGYNRYVVQDLIVQSHNTCYLLERYKLPDGSTRTAELPLDVQGSHFGPTLRSFIGYQYHHQHVTQPLLLEQLLAFGIDISSGQLSNLITHNKDAFHEEKKGILAAGLEISSYIQTDDTGARHKGKNGSCNVICNEQFAHFESTDSKSRINFLEILRQDHKDYVFDEAAYAYFEKQKLPQYVLEVLMDAGVSHFETTECLEKHLASLDIHGECHVRTITEGGLLSSLISHGFKADMRIVSDDAPQFSLFLHALCWLHSERKITGLIPTTKQQEKEIKKVLNRFWGVYKALKAFRAKPLAEKVKKIEKSFGRLLMLPSSSHALTKVLEKLRSNKDKLLLVLKYPDTPIHNNGSEQAIRDYVKKRKISGSTRSENGRKCRDTFASIKKTCRKQGINFWDYLNDRHSKKFQIKLIPDIMRETAAALAF